MQTYTVHCDYCHNIFYKSKRRFNESKKHGWNQYCSKQCQYKAKENRIRFVCNNPQCNTSFTRTPSDLHDGNMYCSRSCAVTVNNSQIPKRKAKVMNCKVCNKSFKSNSYYCSTSCRYYDQTLSQEEIVEKIHTFHNKYGRIPIKAEFGSQRAARRAFGTWNNAIKAAGFKPNPVMFARRHRAKDGHMCDSFAEMVIDDWLHENGIPHQRNVPYGVNSMTADFKVKNTWIEFFGLKGSHNDYDRLVSEKKRLWKEKNLRVIELLPNNLFPTNKLDIVLGHLK